jgi:hypothetical protein
MLGFGLRSDGAFLMGPVFELFLAGYGFGDHGEAFEVDEFVYFVTAGKAVWICAVFVLAHVCFDFGGDADVEALKAAGHDVDVGLVGHIAFFLCALKVEEQATAKAKAKCGGPSTAPLTMRL